MLHYPVADLLVKVGGTGHGKHVQFFSQTFYAFMVNAEGGRPVP